MEVLIKAGQLLLSLSILVTIHEFGHFIAARAFGIKVEKFYLFFDAWGFKLFKYKKGETEYGIGWLPLGGYVKIVGMIDESMDKEFINTEPQPYEFRSKKVWQRMIVILGGIIMNIILGILIFSLHTFFYGKQYTPIENFPNGIIAYSLGKEVGFQDGDKILTINGKEIKSGEDILDNSLLLSSNVKYTVLRGNEKVDIVLPNDFAKKFLDSKNDFIGFGAPFHIEKVMPGSLAEKAGLQLNDKPLSINGRDAFYFSDFTKILQDNKEKEVELKVLRGNDTVALKSMVDKEGKLGFMPKSDIESKTEYYSFIESIQIGNDKAWTTISDNVKGLGKIFTNQIPANKSVSSLIGIGDAFSPIWDWNRFWGLTAMLSMVLAFMNFLPIPALDGGYVIYLIIEAITGKPLSYKVLERAQTVGMFLLMALMAFALYNDISKFFIK